MINNKLGIYNSKIFARKCIIKEISSFDTNKFIFENHIQGIRQAKVKLGLFYNNELVSVMTFGAPNNDKNYELCQHLNVEENILIVFKNACFNRYKNKDFTDKIQNLARVFLILLTCKESSALISL